MRVVQINAVYGHGSTGTIVRDIEQMCEREGVECYVASPDPKVREAYRGYVIGNTLDHKFHALLCRINGRQAYFSHIPTWNLCRFIDRIKPDVVHLHNLHSNYIHLNMLLRHLAKHDIHTVISLHDCWFYTGGCFHYTAAGCDRWQKSCGNCPKKKWDTPAMLFDCSARILRDRIKYLNQIRDLTAVGVSDWISDEFRKSKIKAKRVLTIHNGVNLEVFKPVELNFKKRLGIEDKFVILGPASKWLSDINKETLNFFIKRMPSDTVLLLFGCTEHDSNLPENVIQIEYTRNSVELAALYSSVDVMVNCSREDTLSTINLEAQACGTPVVTYEATGSLETVDENSGFTVETGNFEKLYDYTMQVKSKGKHSYSVACINYIKLNHNKDSRYNDYMLLAFNELTRGGVMLCPSSKWMQKINRKILEFFVEHISDYSSIILFGYITDQELLNLPNGVYSYGLVEDRYELACLYSRANVMANCSREDSLSMINIEAQACGTPVVTFGITGMTETVDGTKSRKVKAGDVEHFLKEAENLIALKTKPDVRNFIKDEYDVKLNYLKFLSIYRDSSIN